MNTSFKAAALAFTALTASYSQAAPAIKVFACEPEWAALTQELAGDLVTVYTATTAQQDPHQVQARPSLMAAVRNADLMVCTGAELEAGWLPVLLRQSGNPKVQLGQAGHFDAADFVRKLEVPTRLDRADGDVHAAGNPHIQTDPRNIATVAQALGKRLAEVDPAHASTYQSRLTDFNARWGQAMQRWTQAAAPLKGMPIVVQHKGFPYLENWLGLNQVAALEPKPGVEERKRLAIPSCPAAASQAALCPLINYADTWTLLFRSPRRAVPGAATALNFGHPSSGRPASLASPLRRSPWPMG